jgi:hypothetical protein
MSSVFHLWLAEIHKADGCNVGETFFPRPLSSIVLNQLQGAGRRGGEDSDELIVVYFGGWCGLLDQQRRDENSRAERDHG